MSTEDLAALIAKELEGRNYFSIKDNKIKTEIRDDLVKKHGVTSVWIKDVVINGLGKVSRRINNDKIKQILGLPSENILQINRIKDDPAEGVVITKAPNVRIYYVSSAPGQAGIGLFKAVGALKSNNADYAAVFINNGNEGAINDSEYNEIKGILDRQGVLSAGVHSTGISHKANLDLQSTLQLKAESRGIGSILAAFAKDSDSIFSGSSAEASRIINSLLSKQFVILTGLAGSGKTKLAQAFSRWITPSPNKIISTIQSSGKEISPYYAVIPVGADWTSNDNVLGYADGIREEIYNSKPSLDLILHAEKHADTPHFLILDEMNLSHVERYFFDILSAIESGEPIPLHSGIDLMSNNDLVPNRQTLPPNLFIIGTVNVDETTYMFSPKVLDRANVIEFRMDETDLGSFLDEPKSVKLEELDGKGY